MNFDPPKLYKRIVCISDDYILSAQLSSCFHKRNTYFAVLEPPRSLHKYWRNEFIKLNNVLAKINAEKIIFLSIKEDMMTLIKDQLHIPESKYTYIADEKELLRFLDKYSSVFKGVIECPPDRKKVAYALLEAKRKEFKLLIKPEAEYKPKIDKENNHLIASDSIDLLLPTMLANYAFSINADIRFFKGEAHYSPKEMYSMISDTRGSDERGKTARGVKKEIKTKLESELKNINGYEFITFFTDDFQYGYFFPDIPNTHIFNKLLVGQFIADAIAKPFIEVDSALLVDTGFFSNSETDDIKALLLKQNVFTKELRDDKFNNVDLDNFIQIYPYDFLFICSHGVFPEGTRFKIGFNDSKGIDHIIVVDVIDSFGITDKGEPDNPIVDVKTTTEFVELDNQPWYQKKYKPGSSKTIVEDFIAIDRKDWNVLEKEDVTMNYSNVIVTKDKLGAYIPMIHGIADPFSSPFIFNNACVSTYTMGVNFIFAGASFYIGTIRNVKDSVAVKTATMFFEKTITQNKSLAFSLWEAQVDAKIPIEDRVHTCVGCHFQKFSFNKIQDAKELLKNRIIRSSMMRLRSSRKRDLEKNVKGRHIDAIKFLRKVMFSIVAESS
ncbi:MAG: hypothetical protein ABSE17_02450 [Candidatus Levyibacteriota bacterium]